MVVLLARFILTYFTRIVILAFKIIIFAGIDFDSVILDNLCFIFQNGGFNALPQLCKFVLTLFAGYFVDLVTTKKWLSTINSCKLAQTIGKRTKWLTKTNTDNR